MRDWIWIAGVLLLAPSLALAQDDDEDNPFAPGLIATYTQAERAASRIEATVALDWPATPPDPRFSPGEIQVVWQGRLLTQGAGDYQLHVHGQGTVQVELGDRLLLLGRANSPQWFSSEKLKLEHDYHPLTIRYSGRAGDKRLRLYWSSETFALEPIAARQLHHEREGKRPTNAFEQGQAVARALRCAACHEMPGEAAPLASPALDRLANHVSAKWLTAYLDEQHIASEKLTREDARDLAALLLKGEAAPTEEAAKGDAAAGKRLFQSLGCLACHALDGQGTTSRLAGGDLSRIAEKRPRSFFAHWLKAPSELNRDHRMPTYDLSATERDDLAAYLSTLGGSNDKAPREAAIGNVQRGEALLAKHECTSCHRVVQQQPPRRQELLKTPTKPACSQFDFAHSASDDELVALRQFLQEIAKAPERSREDEPLDGARILVERNCLNCHAREGAEGLAPKLIALAQADTELAPLVPALTPPSLLAVGDKLNDTVLLAMIKRMEQPHRDYLHVRMPRYDLSQAELEALLAYFVSYDRLPPGAPDERVLPPKDLPKEKELVDAGKKLVVAGSGFGCTSCHAIGSYLPSKAPINARGPNLSNVGYRLREPYFYRWCRNPARIVPGQEMPSVSVPVKGVLKENVDHQLAAVWAVLNTPGFEPKDAGPLRVVNRSGAASDRAVVGTDVLKIEGKTFIKPVIIGLPHRQNVLFDLESGNLARWWSGDTMEQRTQGKTWYWQSEAPALMTGSTKEPELAVLRGSARLLPQLQGQVRWQLQRWSHERGGVTIEGKVVLGEDEKEPQASLDVSQRFAPLAGRPSALERTITIAGLDNGDRVALRVWDTSRSGKAKLSSEATTATFTNGSSVQLLSKNTKLSTDGTLVVESKAGQVQLVIAYDAGQAPAPASSAPAVSSRNKEGSLEVVPGLAAQRLPLDSRIMPTGMSWSGERLYLASLEGRVWSARDTNGDGLEDTSTAASDELAAPYGVHALGKSKMGEQIDVINKFGLLRLTDADDDGFFEQTAALTTDWGHTDDYHDWAVGLVPLGPNRYFAALPCQQDGRSAAAAHRRGQAIEINVDKVDSVISPISLGHRFPMGIARNRDGALFATDNQGNYNPFNELNHVQPGKHFGFINAIDKKKPAPPATGPAVAIPHPWTRSVNGICFLETPKAIRKQQGDLWGDFEGHLVGCEYDTRRLIRISLQKVNDTYQGACYPLSLEKPKGDNFLGPISCAISPRGELYVGSIRDSGWGGGANVGEVVRVAPPAKGSLPPGIAEITAHATGFTVRFTQPVDAALASEVKSYSVASFRRQSTPAYGGQDQERRAEKVVSVKVADDRRSARLELPEMRAGFVYEFHLRPLHAGQFFPAEAFYTLNFLPE